MKITKELLERYELGQCTEAEAAAVSLWLDSTSLSLDDDDELETGIADDAMDDLLIEQEMWQHISAYMQEMADKSNTPERTENNIVFKPAKNNDPTVKFAAFIAIAASLLIILGMGWWFYPTTADKEHFFNASNSDKAVMLWEEDSFEFTLSKNSSASINLQSGNMDVSGDVLFSPKKDFKLFDKHNNTSLDFRQGEVYFISTDPDTSELVVYSKSQLEYLPPILRKHIRKQFHLT
ncbi:hypothetical protein [Sphingobacterium chungjuense]|uniref:hypothetical protein n=1 Tax=Sphingobacterium chungjuense TaxID=2675553 RepID=UPI0014090F08|nr:hypothetical protein [Sphingobacterium chungjuense]